MVTPAVPIGLSSEPLERAPALDERACGLDAGVRSRRRGFCAFTHPMASLESIVRWCLVVPGSTRLVELVDRRQFARGPGGADDDGSPVVRPSRGVFAYDA